MGKVMVSLSMSLDGSVAGPNDDVREVFAWTMSGDTHIPVQGGKETAPMIDTNCSGASITPWCSNHECYEAFVRINITPPGGTI